MYQMNVFRGLLIVSKLLLLLNQCITREKKKNGTQKNPTRTVWSWNLINHQWTCSATISTGHGKSPSCQPFTICWSFSHSWHTFSVLCTLKIQSKELLPQNNSNNCLNTHWFHICAFDMVWRPSDEWRFLCPRLPGSCLQCSHPSPGFFESLLRRALNAFLSSHACRCKAIVRLKLLLHKLVSRKSRAHSFCFFQKGQSREGFHNVQEVEASA